MGFGRWAWRHRRMLLGGGLVAAGAAYYLWRRERESLEQMLIRTILRESEEKTEEGRSLGSGRQLLAHTAVDRRVSRVFTISVSVQFKPSYCLRSHSLVLVACDLVHAACSDRTIYSSTALCAVRRVREHFDATQRECDAALGRELPRVRAHLARLLDVQELRARMRAEGSELSEARWRELQLLAFSRLVAAVYALLLLTLRLRIHLNIVARYYLVESGAGAADGALDRAAKLRFLSTEPLLGHGLEALVDAVRTRNCTRNCTRDCTRDCTSNCTAWLQPYLHATCAHDEHVSDSREVF
eukprot:379525-Pleurochrysis_carterae.AAC.1